MKLIHSPYLFLLPVFVIAAVQATEVIARIKQSMWFHEKFAECGYDESASAISAGYDATVLFILGSIFGMIIGVKGYRESTHRDMKVLRLLYGTAFLSIGVFACVWLGMIASPLVELRSR